MGLFRGLIAGGVRNPVVVNLLMVCILVGGGFAARTMVRESFPQFSLDHIAIETVYPGASPADVERSICVPIEQALRGLRGSRRIISSAQEGFGTVWVGMLSNVKDPHRVMQDIKDRVDQITVFPPEAEKPIVHEKILRAEVINIAIHGDAPERTLKRLAQDTRDDLTAHSEISQVALSGVRDDEITIEVSEEALATYGLSLAQVMDVVASGSLDMPAGMIRTAEEEVTLRITGQRYTAVDYEELVLIALDDATIRLGDVATVREGFEDAAVHGRFNGRRAVLVQVYKTPEEDASTIAAIVRDYVSDRRMWLPERVGMDVWADGSRDIDSRMTMLVKNGVMGALLVFLTLAVFLELRMAFWVACGIPLSIAGALILMQITGQTLNMISLFALIMVSGIIVDDAIVIAESIHERRRAGRASEEASIEGTMRVALPVLGASLTTIAAFVPLLYVAGVLGKFIHVLPVVVIAAIAASAVEAFGILPSHLCHRKPDGAGSATRPPNRLRRVIDARVDHVITHWYRPLCGLALRGRVVTIAVALAMMAVAGGLVLGGRAPLVLLPTEDATILRTRVRLPEGTPASVAMETIDRIEAAARKLNKDPTLKPADGAPFVKEIYSLSGQFSGFLARSGSNLCEVSIEMTPPERRGIDHKQIIEQWRRQIGPIHDALTFTIRPVEIRPPGRPVEVRLLGPDLADLTEAGDRVRAMLEEFEGVTNVSSDLIPGKREMRITLRPAARGLGFMLDNVARQLRYGFFGGEAGRLQRDRDQVKVRVRYPENERRSIADVEQMRITTPSGREIPFREVAQVEWGRSYRNIWHQDGKRRIRIMADLDERRTNAEQIVQTLEAGFLDSVVREYNNMTYMFGGDRERADESLDSMFDGFILAILAMFTILASMLRSYVQPIVIVAAVPFGFIGAIVGHALLGFDLTLMSMAGIVALSGVVVNDSLVLVDAINRGMREGKSVRQSVRGAGEARFRAVILTSITTVAGLTPLLLERSGQAQSVMPMAVALAFGILFATVLTLLVVPALYLLVNDLRRFAFWLRHGGDYPSPEQVEEATSERRLAHG